MCVGALLSPAHVCAQTTKYQWEGTTPAAAARATGDDATVFLLNVGKYKANTAKNGVFWLGRGGKWGTEAVLSNTPYAFTVSSSGSAYILTGTVTEQVDIGNPEGNGAIGFMYRFSSSYNYKNNENDHLSYYIDRPTSADATNIVFTQVDDNKIYQLSNNYISTPSGRKNYYMVAGYNPNSTDKDETSSIDQRINAFSTDSLPSDDTDKWMLVTLKQLKDYFNQVDAAEKDPAIATFLLKDPDFGRNDNAVSNWKTATGNDLQNESRQGITPSTQTGCYVGVGSTDNQTYGHQWTASIKGTGSIQQTIKPIRAGWYAVRVNACLWGSGKAVLYASYDGQTVATSSLTPYSEAEISTVGTTLPANYYDAESEVNNGNHQLTVMVYVSDINKELTLGVKVTEGDGAWTCVDNFQLYYHGVPKCVVLLDEDLTDINYINQQRKHINDINPTERQNSTVHLRRAMNTGKWNSIVLPFAINQDVIQHVFGSGTIVSELKGANNPDHPNRIYFEQVNNMAAGKLYIIKPTKDQPTNQPAVESSATKSDGTNEKVHKFPEGESYWTFSPVNFGQDADYEANINDAANSGNETYNSGKVYFAGTYISHGEDLFIPANSYVLSYSKTANAEPGKWYYRTKGTKTKGFRGWLQTTDPSAQAITSISINGVVDGETTGIEGLIESPQVLNEVNGVYNLSGQLVRNGSSIEGLSRGIYIVGGKKVVVR